MAEKWKIRVAGVRMGGEESRAHPLETPLPSPLRQYEE